MSKLAGNERLGEIRMLRASRERLLETLHALGFEPAYFDYATCTTYPSRHADGRPAAAHVPDGLPDEAVAVRSDCGKVIAAKATLIAGFSRRGYFYTHAAAWRAAKEWGPGA